MTLTRDFWMMTTEVTQAQFESVMGYNPSYFTACGPTCPVEQANWHEFAAYANALSQSEGLGECYSCTGTAPNFDCAPSVSYATAYDCPGYRLPTEAEWEYAARGGTTTATYNGNLETHPTCDPRLHRTRRWSPIAWFCGNASNTTHPVGTKTANAYGLYDMLGNVWEWCHDWYGAYPGGAETDPTGAASGSDRVLRGGSWYGDAWDARAASRGDDSPGDRFTGMRGALGEVSPISHHHAPFSSIGLSASAFGSVGMSVCGSETKSLPRRPRSAETTRRQVGEIRSPKRAGARILTF